MAWPGGLAGTPSWNKFRVGAGSASHPWAFPASRATGGADPERWPARRRPGQQRGRADPVVASRRRHRAGAGAATSRPLADGKPTEGRICVLNQYFSRHAVICAFACPGPGKLEFRTNAAMLGRGGKRLLPSGRGAP